MRVIAASTPRAFWETPGHRDAGQPLGAWYQEASRAARAKPADLKAQFRNAGIPKGGRVVFDIKGNDYRLVAGIAYRQRIVFVKFVGTHAQYDAIDADTVEPV